MPKRESLRDILGQSVADVVQEIRGVINNFQQEIDEEIALNKTVKQIEAELPIINSFLEGLRERLGVKSVVKKFSPRDGRIAYALPYFSRLMPYLDGGEDSFTGFSIPIRRERFVLGVILDHKGMITVKDQVCANVHSLPKSINPLRWIEWAKSTTPKRYETYPRYSRDWIDGNDIYRGVEKNKREITAALENNYPINTPEGAQRFAQDLNSFYNLVRTE